MKLEEKKNDEIGENHDKIHPGIIFIVMNEEQVDVQWNLKNTCLLC
jgi:hypothetical protein